MQAKYDGVESLRLLSGDFPPGIKPANTKITSLGPNHYGTSKPTQVGTYTFVMRATSQPGYVNSRGESIVDVTIIYVVTNN